MLSVAASDVSAMFATLFGKAVDVTDSPGAAALDAVALSVFVTAEQETIAVFAMDTAAAAATASALTDEPVDGAEAAIAAAKLDGDLWENFAEIGNVMSGLLRGDRFPRVLLHSVSQVGRAEWDALVSAALESSTFTLTVEGYPAGNLTIFDVIDAPPGSIPAFLQEINPTNAAAEVDVDRWRPYSFSKPRTVSHEELRTLQSRAEDLVAALTTACNGLVSPPIRQKLLQTQSKVWEDYAANVVSPSLMISFQLRPLEGRFILTWPLELVMAFVDLMLGGSGQPLAAPGSPRASTWRWPVPSTAAPWNGCPTSSPTSPRSASRTSASTSTPARSPACPPRATSWCCGCRPRSAASSTRPPSACPCSPCAPSSTCCSPTPRNPTARTRWCASGSSTSCSR